MAERLISWRMVEPGRPLVLFEEPLPVPGPGEVLLRVRACGLCHTDAAFLYDGVRPRGALPLTLGHEIVGEVEAAGEGASDLLGVTVIVPAVLPCGECELCRYGRANACLAQKMPGNDFHGGLASHVLAPARFLYPVPAGAGAPEELAVVADAVATSYQAVLRSGIHEGDLVIVVGTGGVGSFAVQAARARGARVAAIEVDPARLEVLAEWVELPLDASCTDLRGLRDAVADFERRHRLRPWGRKVLECSGTVAGQETAWALLGTDATLAVVGYTREKASLRLANLMAFDARAFGNWGCAPEHFPAILDLVVAGKLVLGPFVERHPMSRANELLRERPARRPVLIPDFGR